MTLHITFLSIDTTNSKFLLLTNQVAYLCEHHLDYQQCGKKGNISWITNLVKCFWGFSSLLAFLVSSMLIHLCFQLYGLLCSKDDSYTLS